MAQYVAEYRDVAGLAKRQLARGLFHAFLVWAAVFVLATLWASEPTGVTILGFGMGAATVLVCEAYLRYRSARAIYGPEGVSVALTVDAEGLEVATDQKRTHFSRSGGVRVIESAGVFLIDPDRMPVAIPVRQLSPDEQNLLRDWVRQGEHVLPGEGGRRTGG